MEILVTPRSLTRGGHPALDRLKKAGYNLVFSTPGVFPTEDELVALIPECAGYLAGVEPVSAKVLEAAEELKAISRNGTGVDNIDLKRARELGIVVCRTEGANARGVAELTFSLILSLVRAVPFSDAELKEERWSRRKGVELEGRTLGLVGCGRIGQLTARFARAFGMQVLAYDPHPSETFASLDGFSFAPLERVLAEADVLSLHCPALPDGAALINRQTLAGTKDGVFLVNTARGSLLDQDAVFEGLESGKIAGVAVDAFDPEPPEDWRLVKDRRVIATAHLGAFTEESMNRAVTMAVDNLLKELKTTRRD